MAIVDENNIKSDNNIIELEENIKKNVSPKYIRIKFEDLFKKSNEYDKKCFCYLVITEQSMKEFYRYWS